MVIIIVVWSCSVDDDSV